MRRFESSISLGPAAGADDPKLGIQPVVRTARFVGFTMFHRQNQGLHFLSQLCEGSRGVFGGALSSMVFASGFSGDIVAQDLAKEILRSVDPYGEFFVIADASVPLEDLWNRAYSLELEMVPSFISLELARKILLTGKSVNFIRLCCERVTILSATMHIESDLTIVDATEASVMIHKLIDSATAMEVVDICAGYSIMSAGYPWIGCQVRCHVEINPRYAAWLKTKQVPVIEGEHALALRRFLLLGQGDFVQSLMDALQEELDIDANKIHKHQLMGILEMALRQSNAQFCSVDVLGRLGIKLRSPERGERGWDVFLLDYSIDSPLHVVFTPNIMQKYDRAFSFLRVSHALAASWNQHMALQRHLCRDQRDSLDRLSLLETRQTLHRCTLLRHEMHHFVQNVQSYVLEVGF
eukprot:g2975.t1